MKHILKYLSSLSFVILFLPFFDMCSSAPNGDKNETIEDSIATYDTINYSKNEICTDTSEAEVVDSSKSDKNFTTVLNGYQMGLVIFDYKSDSTIKSNLKHISRDLPSQFGPEFFPYLIFTILIVLLIVVFTYSLKNKIIVVKNISMINLGLVLVSIILLLSINHAEINQFKFGYYLLILNLVAILYVIKKKYYLEKPLN